MTFEMIYYINLGGDIFDIASVCDSPTWSPSKRSHCSGLVRLTPNLTDIFVSQATWTAINGMLRTFKLYDFPFRLNGISDERVPAIRSSFSSYPGSIFSGDDFYVLSSGLVVQETTIGFDNPELEQYIVPAVVFEWLRNVLANRLANDGPTWVQVFSQFNSGSYNNQNMVSTIFFLLFFFILQRSLITSCSFPASLWSTTHSGCASRCPVTFTVMISPSISCKPDTSEAVSFTSLILLIPQTILHSTAQSEMFRAPMLTLRSMALSSPTRGRLAIKYSSATCQI